MDLFSDDDRDDRDDDEEQSEDVPEVQVGEETKTGPAETGPDIVDIPPPNLQNTRFGLWKTYQYRKKVRKYASKGYVKWYLVDDTIPTAKFVKPEGKGGGIPEYEHNGNTYLFPRSEALPSEENGMWVYMHKKGEADPIPLRDPLKDPIPVDVLDEYLTMRPSSSPPSWLGSLDIDPKQAITWMMILIIGVALLRGILQMVM